jgi:hypothetical protein
MWTMRTIALAALLVFGLVSSADAGRRGGGGGGSHSSRSHSGSHSGGRSGTTGTGSSSNSHAVRGYTTKRGTYVAPHRQTDPDHTQRNNYSTKGNVNPWTGKAGTRNATR